MQSIIFAENRCDMDKIGLAEIEKSVYYNKCVSTPFS